MPWSPPTDAPPTAATATTGPIVAGMSTRMLILASLLCGLAILVAFTVQILLARG